MKNKQLTKFVSIDIWPVFFSTFVWKIFENKIYVIVLQIMFDNSISVFTP